MILLYSFFHNSMAKVTPQDCEASLMSVWDPSAKTTAERWLKGCFRPFQSMGFPKKLDSWGIMSFCLTLKWLASFENAKHLLPPLAGFLLKV